jgi:hypothetical protein
MPIGFLVQVVFFAAAWPLRLLFCEVGFELLMRLADVGLVFHQGGKGLLDQVMIEVFDVE